MGFVGRGCCKVGEVYRWGVVGAGAAPLMGSDIVDGNKDYIYIENVSCEHELAYSLKYIY